MFFNCIIAGSKYKCLPGPCSISKCSWHHILPVDPPPVWTSSTSREMSCLWAILSNPWRKIKKKLLFFSFDNIEGSLEEQFLQGNILSNYLEKFLGTMVISTFSLNWFNNHTSHRNTNFGLIFNLFFNCCQTSFIFCLIFSNKFF